ncbi:hypothetical protein DdX_08665 [Ditylenchus destructor]|uniref:Uncharacterized protein n=1 Tax=Ditylenchus destructor TaxID=166010 RepID=A0AAD4N6H9_9BILA|nr:hypothetical protein DdX_08665 [Ditylenchus destructor]
MAYHIGSFTSEELEMIVRHAVTNLYSASQVQQSPDEIPICLDKGDHIELLIDGVTEVLTNLSNIFVASSCRNIPTEQLQFLVDASYFSLAAARTRRRLKSKKTFAKLASTRHYMQFPLGRAVNHVLASYSGNCHDRYHICKSIAEIFTTGAQPNECHSTFLSEEQLTHYYGVIRSHLQTVLPNENPSRKLQSLLMQDLKFSELLQRVADMPKCRQPRKKKSDSRPIVITNEIDSESCPEGSLDANTNSYAPTQSADINTDTECSQCSSRGFSKSESIPARTSEQTMHTFKPNFCPNDLAEQQLETREYKEKVSIGILEFPE